MHGSAGPERARSGPAGNAGLVRNRACGVCHSVILPPPPTHIQNSVGTGCIRCMAQQGPDLPGRGRLGFRSRQVCPAA